MVTKQGRGRNRGSIVPDAKGQRESGSWSLWSWSRWASSLIGCAPLTRMSRLELEAHFLNSTLTRSPGGRAQQLPLSAGLRSVGLCVSQPGTRASSHLLARPGSGLGWNIPVCSNVDAVIKRQAVSSYLVVPASGPPGILLASRLRDHCCPLKVFAVSSVSIELGSGAICPCSLPRIVGGP